MNFHLRTLWQIGFIFFLLILCVGIVKSNLPPDNTGRCPNSRPMDISNGPDGAGDGSDDDDCDECNGGGGGGGGGRSGGSNCGGGPELHVVQAPNDQGDPVDVTRGCVVQGIQDFSLPVKYGLQLNVGRTFSKREMFPANRKGNVSLGFSNASGIKSNWHLYLYESRVQRTGINWTGEGAIDHDHLNYFNEYGSWVHFSYCNTQSNSQMGADANKLIDPTMNPPSSFYVSKYLPIGTPGCLDQNDGRETTEDMALYVIHSGNFTDPETSTRLENQYVQGYVLRFADGRQLHYAGENLSILNNGLLIYYDANWRNNKPSNNADDPERIDDYLELFWSEGKSEGSGEDVPILDRVKAPPSDGRYLEFIHPNYTADVSKDASHVTAVNLCIGTTTYQNILTYDYVSSASYSQGKLWRVRKGANSKIWTQYDYGKLVWSGNQPAVEDETYTYDQELVLVSEAEDLGGGNFAVRGLTAHEIVQEPGQGEFLYEYVRDPLEDYWRTSFKLHLTYGEGDDLYYLAGNIVHDSHTGTYNYDQTKTTIHHNWSHDLTHYDYANAPNTPPQVKYAYTSEGNRLLGEKLIYVGTEWIPTERYEYDSPDSGIAKITSITKYTDFEQQSSEITTYRYLDSDNPDAPSEIEHPDGKTDKFNYNSLGQLIEHTRWVGETRLTLTTYEYYQNYPKRGLIHALSVSQGSAPSKTTTYDYYDDIGDRAGLLKSVTSNVETAYYNDYDDFGNPCEIVTSVGTTTNVYSGSGQVDTFVPPRLIKTTEPNNAITSYSYNLHGDLAAFTAAWNTSNAKRTNYLYDRFGNQVLMDVSPNTFPNISDEDVAFCHDTYGNLLSVWDAENSGTFYGYDAFGRLVAEWAVKPNGSSPLTTTNYTYVDNSSGCSSCGGGLKLVKKVEVVSGDNASSKTTINYKYNMLGQVISQGVGTSDNDVNYYYSGNHLWRIQQDWALWGSHDLRYDYDEWGRVAHEYYPNGRFIEYKYDGGNKLQSIKDPFGFITELTYTDDRVSSLSHSALGKAHLVYAGATNDRLVSLKLPNGARTDYEYDTYKRLNKFTHYANGSSTPILRHDWTYDNLGRKGTINVYAPTLGTGTLTPGYDGVSRLSQETLTLDSSTVWDGEYEYDRAGNRTSVYDMVHDQAYNFTYNASSAGQNREATASATPGGSLTPLGYDWRGNVVTRHPLGGGNPYLYTWDAYNRLTQAKRWNGTWWNTVNYTYDALGRLLKRDDNTPSGPGVTVNYWLGLNKIAEERWGEYNQGIAVKRPHVDYTHSSGNGWYIYKSPVGGQIETVADAERGTVRRLRSGSSTARSGVFLLGDDKTGNDNPNDYPWNESQRCIIGLWIKNADPDHAPIQIGVLVTHNNDTEQFNLNWVTDTATPAYSYSGGCGYIHLGSYSSTNYNDGQWHYLELNVPNVYNLVRGSYYDKINGLVIKGVDVYVDDVDDLIVSNGAMLRTYQLVPGAKIMGCLGSHGRTWLNEPSSTYYQYNELGTVLVTTDVTGYPNSISEPDYFGNYRLVSGTRPDSMGLTGKFFDSGSGLYYFNARWFDSERGHWMSKDPIAFIGGINLYAYCANKPSYHVDVNGKKNVVGWIVEIGAKFRKCMAKGLTAEDALRCAKEGEDIICKNSSAARDIAEKGSKGRPIGPEIHPGDGQRPHYHFDNHQGGHIFFCLADILGVTDINNCWELCGPGNANGISPGAFPCCVMMGYEMFLEYLKEERGPYKGA